MKQKQFSRLLSMALVLVFALVLCAPAFAANTTVYATTALNVRTGPSTSYPIVGVLQSGQSVTKIGTSGAWYQIYYGSTIAYAHGNYLETYVTTTTPSVSTGDTVMVNYGSVNIRTGPSTDYTRIGVVSAGQTLTRTGIHGNWTQILYNGQTAYIYSAYVTPMTSSLTPVFPDGSSTPTVVGNAQIADGAYLYSAPSTSSKYQVNYLPTGTVVTVINSYSSDWSFVAYGSYNGYVKTYELVNYGAVSTVPDTSYDYDDLYPYQAIVAPKVDARVYSTPSYTTWGVGYLDAWTHTLATGKVGEFTQIVYGGGIGYILSEQLFVVDSSIRGDYDDYVVAEDDIRLYNDRDDACERSGGGVTMHEDSVAYLYSIYEYDYTDPDDGSKDTYDMARVEYDGETYYTTDVDELRDVPRIPNDFYFYWD